MNGFSLGHSEIIRETDSALLLETEEAGEVWIPKSVIHDDSEIEAGDDEGDEGEVIVKKWFARNEGWI